VSDVAGAELLRLRAALREFFPAALKAFDSDAPAVWPPPASIIRPPSASAAPSRANSTSRPTNCADCSTSLRQQEPVKPSIQGR
jgi:hypothetical protein